MEKAKYAMITGASRGLGANLAEGCARRGMNLLLLSLPEEGLEEKATVLAEEHSIDVRTFELDLCDKEALEEVAEKINSEFEVNYLINNAGFGGARSFETTDIPYLDEMILLNIRALVLLTRLLLSNLKKQGGAHILNIASMASFGPMPFKTVYPASKAFVLSFSRGLNTELRGSGVLVSTVHPGGMPTNNEVSQRIEQHGRLARSTFMSPAAVAEISIRQSLKGKSVIIPGSMNKVSRLLFRIIPVPQQLRILRRTFIKEASAK